MNKSPKKIQSGNNKNDKQNDPNIMKNYIISFIFKIISACILLILILLQLECLLLFIIHLINNNIYFIILLELIFHLLFIRFIVQSILYVLHCPLLDSLCFYSISCNQISQLFVSAQNFVSLYKKIQKKNNGLEQKDILIIENIGNIINAYLYFFKVIKSGGKLSPNQNAVYIKLGLWMKIFDDYKKCLHSFNENSEEEKEILDENKHQDLMLFIKKMAIESNAIIKLLNDFIGDNNEILSFKNLYNCFVNYDFFSLEQFSILFHKRFNNTYNYFITNDNQIIDYTIISYEKLDEMYKYNPKSKIKEPIKIEFNSKNLLLFCNPNGMIYQLFTPDKFLPFLEGGCDILLWNYRGYGGSSGYPTFKNAKTDALELFDYAKKKYINYNKFGVYGYSVGGGSAIFVANQRKLDVLICDRNFTNVSEIVKDIPYVGWFLNYLVKVLNFKYDYNINEFMNSKNKNICKIVLCDPDDEIIPNSASLKAGISKYIIKNYCAKHKLKIKENILELFLGSKDNLENKFIEALFNISSILKRFDENPFQDIIKTKKNKTNNKNEKTNLNDFLLLNVSSNYNSDKKYFKNILIKTIIKIFNCFKFSAENLDNFKKKDENRLKVLFINNYFNNFIVWGSISKDKILEANGFTNPFTTKNNISYLDSAINSISEFFEDKVVKNFENDEDYKTIIEHMNVIKKCLKIMRDNCEIFGQGNMFNKGNLIRLNCGHNGNFSDVDNKNLIDILKVVKFIY